MAAGEPYEWTKDMLLFAELARAVRKGGLLATERSALSERFGVSEDLLRRYERAKSIYNAEIFNELRSRANVEAMRRLKQLGKDPWGPDDENEFAKAYYRLEAEMSDNEIVREYKAVMAAIRAALGVPISEE